MSKVIQIDNKPLSTDENIMARILLTGDIACLSDIEKFLYMKRICERLEIDPMTQPFRILANKKTGSEVLYATKGCGEQLAERRKLSPIPGEVEIWEARGLAKCIAETADASGRRAKASGFVSLQYFASNGALTWLRGDDLCNALMKCETKAVQRSILRLVGLGMPSETEIETIAYSEPSYTNQELFARGNILTAEQRKEVIAWWRANAPALRAQNDSTTNDQIIYQCFAELQYTTPLGVVGDQSAAQLRDQMVAEAIEAALLDEQETVRRRAATPRGAAIVTVNETTGHLATNDGTVLTAEELTNCIAQLDKWRKSKKDAETSPLDLVQRVIEKFKIPQTDGNKNLLLQRWIESESVAKEPAEVVDSATGPRVATIPENPLEKARETVPSVSEMTGKKKPVSEEAAAKLGSVLETIRLESEKRESPSYESERALIKQITEVVQWPADAVRKIMKEKFRIHSATMDDPAVFTWDLVAEVCKYFATHKPPNQEG